MRVMNLKILVKMSNGKGLKGLTLRDIHVGDWARYKTNRMDKCTGPMEIVAIYKDGHVAFDRRDGRHEIVPINEVFALPITHNILRGFGFDMIMGSDSYRFGNNEFYYNKTDKCLVVNHLKYNKIEYFQELQDILDMHYCINYKWMEGAC